MGTDMSKRLIKKRNRRCIRVLEQIIANIRNIPVSNGGINPFSLYPFHILMAIWIDNRIFAAKYITIES
jgi:hypothetical protein